ncbi:MAG TPA: acyl-CoA dehydrogenase family protein [Acidimicrobiales bacterium]|nr:acyl-CoA dehydrogenase family protein [Acidimicrobiales bacterium]
MDFDDTPAEAGFRAEARAWLEGHARPKTSASPLRSPFAHLDPDADAEHVRCCKDWQRTLYDGGWAGITWPKEYGGRGCTAIEAAVFSQEQARFDVAVGVFAVGIGMVGPTLIAHGSDAHKQRFLDPLLRGEDVWCQLFSEPGAGSDLAGLATRAVRDGDEWVVNGQKVWTSGAHHSDWGILLARSDVDVPKHRGITYFLVDMRTPGVDVRPLRQINGAAHFNEVFLTDVRVPAANVVGEVNGGWRVAQTTLTSERTLIGSASGLGWVDVVGHARRMGRTTDPQTRQALAKTYSRFEVLRYLGLRVQTAISRGETPGPESSVLKLAYSRHVAANGDLVLALEGVRGTLLGADAPDAGFWQQCFLGQWSSRIGGGTDQIQRNVIGERVLGLPREPHPDKDLPFHELPR